MCDAWRRDRCVARDGARDVVLVVVARARASHRHTDRAACELGDDGSGRRAAARLHDSDSTTQLGAGDTGALARRTGWRANGDRRAGASGGHTHACSKLAHACVSQGRTSQTTVVAHDRADASAAAAAAHAEAALAAAAVVAYTCAAAAAIAAAWAGGDRAALPRHHLRAYDRMVPRGAARAACAAATARTSATLATAAVAATAVAAADRAAAVRSIAALGAERDRGARAQHPGRACVL